MADAVNKSLIDYQKPAIDDKRSAVDMIKSAIEQQKYNEHGKKSVGGINRIVMVAQYFDKKLEKEAKYQWELSEYLNRDICQPEGFDAYGYPSELFKLDMERLGIIPKRKPAKIIDFTRYIDTNRSSNH